MAYVHVDLMIVRTAFWLSEGSLPCLFINGKDGCIQPMVSNCMAVANHYLLVKKIKPYFD